MAGVRYFALGLLCGMAIPPAVLTLLAWLAVHEDAEAVERADG